MTSWKSFGASVRGPGHITTNLPNQDEWAAFHATWGDGIVVSDGIGSKLFSDFGSKAACCAVENAVAKFLKMTQKNHNFLFDCIKENWLLQIKPLKPRDCSATCLFGFRLGDGILHLGMLGDGLVAAVNLDGSVIVLEEDKSQGFSNITTALSINTTAKNWRYLSLLEKDYTAIFLATDGVSDDLTNIEGFVTGFVKTFSRLASISANRHIREMLENWSTPKHSDDKSIACLCCEEIIYE